MAAFEALVWVPVRPPIPLWSCSYSAFAQSLLAALIVVAECDSSSASVEKPAQARDVVAGWRALRRQRNEEQEEGLLGDREVAR